MGLLVTAIARIVCAGIRNMKIRKIVQIDIKYIENGNKFLRILFSVIFEMLTLFITRVEAKQMSICPNKKKVQFMPEKWQQDLGENCYGCRQRITTENCVSLCHCRMYTHEECFLKQFAPYVGPHKVECIRCEYELDIQKNYHTEWAFSNLKKPITIITIILSVFMLVAFIVMTAVGLYQPFPAGAVYGIIAGAAVILFIAILLSLRRKTLKLEDVHVYDTGMIDRIGSGKDIKSIDGSDFQSSGKQQNNFL